MESDGSVRTPGSAAYFLVGSSRVSCGSAVSGQLTIPVGRPMSNQDVSGPSLIVQMTPSRSQTQDHHARTTVVRTANQPVTMHRFPLQLNHTSANHILSPNQHFKHIPVYQQRNTSSIQMESVRKNVFVSTPVASPQLPYNRVGLTPHMLMTYMPSRNRLPNNQRTRVVPVNRPNTVLKQDHSTSDDDILEITDLKPLYDPKNPVDLIKVEHNYCFIPRVTHHRKNKQVNGSTPKLNLSAGKSCIVSPTVSQTQTPQCNVVTNNNRVIQKPLNTPINVPVTNTESPLQPLVKCESPIQIESELSASDHDLDGQGEETDTAPEAVAEGKDNVKSEEPAITRCICEMEHDDGFMISCDKCLVWQHVDCVLESRNNLPEEYLCERCSPRPFNREAAAALQHMKLAKRISMASASHLTHSSDSDISTEIDMPIDRNNIKNKRKKYKSRQKNVPKRKPGLQTQMKQRRKNGPPQSGPRKKCSMTPEKKALAEERKKMLIKRKEMLLEKKRLAAMDKKKKVNQEKKIQKKKTIDSSDDEPKIFKVDKPNKHNKSNIDQSVDQLRNWIDKYEEAVTNHYSQELRARLSSIKPNGTIITGEIRTPVKIPISRTKISLLPSGIKMLVSSSVLANNQPIIEVRGKFTWTGSLAYKDPIPNRTDPYVFFYVVRFSTDCDIEVCVDCRTYGNDARFVRRSCKPNAELKHYIEKGSIHLYIVANQYIEKNSEITISHQAAVPFKRCNCGDPSKCTAMNPISPVTAPPVSVILESSLSPLIDPTVSHSSDDDDDSKPQRNKRTRQQRNMKKSNNKRILKRKTSKCETPSPPSSIKNKEPNGPGRPKSPVKKVETSPEPLDHKSNNNDKMVKRLNEMSREERKMVAIMKAFERMEKKEARKQESRLHKETDNFNNSSPLNLNRNRVRKGVVKRKQRPSNKTGRSKSTRTNRPQRRAAAISSRSYNSSSDEDDNNNDDDDDNDDRKGRLLSRKRAQNRCKFSVRFQHRPSTQSSVSRSMLRRSPHSNLLNTPANKIDSEDASGSEGTLPTPLSNTCMLVAAAVGPLAPGFKFPNTKKDFVNSWVKSEGNSPTGSEDYKLGEVGCAKKRWLQQAISEQDSGGINNGDQKVGPLKKRRMARESMSECPSPTVSGSGHLSFVEDDIIEDEEVEQASRNIASIDSKLAIFKNKNVSLMDIQKSSNTVALVESFLGEFKPDEESSSEPSLDNKSNIKMISENQNYDSQISKEEILNTLSKKTQKLKIEVSNKMKSYQLDTADINLAVHKYDDAPKETIEKCFVHKKQSPPPPSPQLQPSPQSPPPPPPVKRKLSISEYRRRKESQATVTKEKETESGASDATRPSPSVSPNTSLAAYEEITQQVIAKSLELESKLALKSGPSIFESSVSKEEPKWENLNDRLRRQFGVNITEDLPKRHPRLSPPDFTPIEHSRYPYYHRSEEQLYSCAKEDILLPSTVIHENGPPKLFTPSSQAYFSSMFFRQPPPPPPPPPV